MKSLKRDLLERRLWLLAVVIVAAIVAIPFVLHRHRATVVIAPPPAQTSQPAPAAAHPRRSHVTPTTPTSQSRDPFEAASVSVLSSSASSTQGRSPAASTTGTAPGSALAPSVSTSGPGAGGSAASPATTTTSPPPATLPVSRTSPPVSTAPAETSSPHRSTHRSTHRRRATSRSRHSRARHRPATTKRWEVTAVDLRIGAPGHLIAHHDIARLTPLPRERSPQLMYMGVSDHGRSAVFALGAGVVVRSGAAKRPSGVRCHPSRQDCALVLVPAGRRIALSYVSATGPQRTLVLQLSRITSRVTRSAATARAARRHVSAIGLCDLKLGDPIGFFDPAAESVTIPSVRACRRHRLAVAFPGSLGAGSSERG